MVSGNLEGAVRSRRGRKEKEWIDRVHTEQRPGVCHVRMDQPSKVANPDRGQLNRENYFPFLSPFAPDNLVPRDRFGRPVPRHPAHSLYLS